MGDLSKLVHHLEQQGEGELRVTSSVGVWKFYLADGRLLFPSGEVHPVRRLRRALRQHLSKWQWYVDPVWQSDPQSWEIPLVEWAMAQNKLSPIQVKLVLRTVLQECLFELICDVNGESEWQPFKREISPLYRFVALSVIEIQTLLNKMNNMCELWQTYSMGYFSPTLAPVLSESDTNEQLPVSRDFLRGEMNLWDLAIEHKQSPTQLINSLLPLIEKGTVALEKIPDLPLPLKEQLATTPAVAAKPAVKAQQNVSNFLRPQNSVTKTSKAPLIACIDDSPVLAHTLKKILSSAGYRTLSIPEPMRGFAQLIEHKPDLILLDLMLPNADGYSVCKFLRETPVFEKTPILILTGKNSSINRVKARLAGATEFLTKPPHKETLLRMIRMYLTQNRRSV